MDILDQVIKTIRASKNKADAKDNLVKEYDFSPRQAEAIVSLQLYRLTNTDVEALVKEQTDLNKKVLEYRKILTDESTLDKEIIKELRQVKKDFGNPRRTEISDQTAKIEIDEKALVADEQVRVLISRDGYLKRSSLRSYQSTSDDDNGLPERDQVIFEKDISTLANLYLFTNKGNVIYRPVHELIDTKWKGTGQHLSQEIGLAADEQIIRVFEIPDFERDDLTFVLATNDGYIKRLNLSNIQPTRTYRSRAMSAIKLKNDNSTVVRVDLTSVDSKQEITLFTQKAYAVRFDLAEVPESGAKAAGVKSVNLKDDDNIVAYVLADPAYLDLLRVGIITNRGAFKQMQLDIINKVSRAKRGVLVLRELKNNPHRIAAIQLYGQDHLLKIMTSSDRKLEVNTLDFPVNDRYSNGSFVVDTTVDGTPVAMILGKPVANGDSKSLF